MTTAKDKKYHIIGKIYITAQFKLASPLIIGSGESDHADIDVLHEPDADGKLWPIIPGSSIVGVFRHVFDELVELKQKDEKFQDVFFEFFGDDAAREKNKRNANRAEYLCQSAVSINDVVLKEAVISIRDSVKIDSRTATAKDGSKFDYQIVESAQPFDVIFEITLRKYQGDVEGFAARAKNFVGIFLDQIHNGHVRFGAKTNKGFGKLEFCQFKNTAPLIKVADLHFSNENDARAWLWNDIKGSNIKVSELLKDSKFKLVNSYFEIIGEFRIKNSFLIRSYPSGPEEPDAVHIKSDGKYVLPGTSVMGAIRHQAWKIMNTMEVKNKEEKFYNLFGFVVTNDDYPKFPQSIVEKIDGKDVVKKVAGKGRVMVDETVIGEGLESIISEVQTRIKIDRFTGGTISSALFDAMPLWQKGMNSTVKINLRITKYEDWEAGLMLFILKDLVTGDLPIGGEKSIGRGVLIGNKADLIWSNGTVKKETLYFDEDGFVKNQKVLDNEEIQKLVAAWDKEVTHGR